MPRPKCIVLELPACASSPHPGQVQAIDSGRQRRYHFKPGENQIGSTAVG